MREKVLNVFKDELAMIKDDGIRAFVLSVFDDVNPKFFTDPASYTGKYHPPHDNGVGGLVRHTKVACYFGQQFLRVYEINDQLQADLTTAALLLHDIGKPITLKKGEPDFVPHEVLGYQLTLKHVGSPLLMAIAEAVLYHAGPWTPHDTVRFVGLSPLNQVVHLADYTAAQKRLRFEFEEKRPWWRRLACAGL